nr:MAG TPA: hypothetical protein [Caudoviricetes sp.]
MFYTLIDSSLSNCLFSGVLALGSVSIALRN